MITTEEELRREMDLHWSSGRSGLRVVPPEGLDGADGCVVVDSRSGTWQVYVLESGRPDLREFTTEAEAFDHAHRRWVPWDEDA